MIWNKEKILSYLEKDKWEVYIIDKKESKPWRTRQQNNFFYWLFGSIEKQTPFSSEVIKQYILSRVFWKKEVYWELINNKTHTSELTKKEAWDLINWIMNFCIENSLEMKYTSKELESLYLTYK